ncbi:MAG: hypothetical protein AB4290_12820 [Spirulina sp.]
MKLFSWVLGALLLLGWGFAIAGTCTAQRSCVPPRLQFVPGQTIRVEVINRTTIPIEVQQLGGSLTVNDFLTITNFPAQLLTLIES